MNFEELSERMFTGGKHVIGYIKMKDMHEFDRDHGIERHFVRGYPTDYTVRDSNVLSALSGDADFGYKIKCIKAAISIFKLMHVNERDIVLHFPDKDAPLILTIASTASRRIGLEWGILICSCGVEAEEDT